LDAFCALSLDYETAVPPSRAALSRLCGGHVNLSEKFRWFLHGTVLAHALWDDGAADFLSSHHVTAARDRGALSELALALSMRTPLLVFCGDRDASEGAVEEARGVHKATRIRVVPVGELMVSAWSGTDPLQAKHVIRAAISEARSRGAGIAITASEYAYAVLCNSLGDYEEAAAAALSATGDPNAELSITYHYNWALPELVEAAMRAGQVEAAEDALHRLERRARASGTDWARGVAARSQALLTQESGADALYREAIDRLGRTRVRAELARAHLLYGEWLRRTRRRMDARAELAKAHEMFTAMGMAAFAERARRELVATGATARRRSVDTREALTPQELLIAGLARDGHSNPEIGAQLFISARTVEWHMRRVFTKLDISSRGQLWQALSHRELTSVRDRRRRV
jgi:DNA-binding CsgD family transcriptional regulator